MRVPARGIGCYGRSCDRWRAGARRGAGARHTAELSRVPAEQGHALGLGGTMKSLKKESRLKIPASRFLEAAESLKGWRWLPWELRRTRQGQGFLDGIHEKGPGGWGNTRMEVKITGEWGTGQGVPHTLGMMDKAETRKGRGHRALGP